MYEIMPDTTQDLLAIRVSGKLRERDYDRLGPVLQAKLAERDHPSLLVVMDDFDGWSSPSALMEDAKLDTEIAGDVPRIAMVGDKAWQEWLTSMAKPFTSSEIRYFDKDDLGAAKSWLKGRQAL